MHRVNLSYKDKQKRVKLFVANEEYKTQQGQVETYNYYEFCSFHRIMTFISYVENNN